MGRRPLVGPGVVDTDHLPPAKVAVTFVAPYGGPGLTETEGGVGKSGRWMGPGHCDCTLVSRVVSGSQRRAPRIPLTIVIFGRVKAYL